MIPQYTEMIHRRRDAGADRLRPYIAGWAQVTGRNTISMDAKFILDVDYLNQQSVVFDLYIIYRAFIYVFSARGIWH